MGFKRCTRQPRHVRRRTPLVRVRMRVGVRVRVRVRVSSHEG